MITGEMAIRLTSPQWLSIQDITEISESFSGSPEERVKAAKLIAEAALSENDWISRMLTREPWEITQLKKGNIKVINH